MEKKTWSNTTFHSFSRFHRHVITYIYQKHTLSTATALFRRFLLQHTHRFLAAVVHFASGILHTFCLPSNLDLRAKMWKENILYHQGRKLQVITWLITRMKYVQLRCAFKCLKFCFEWNLHQTEWISKHILLFALLITHLIQRLSSLIDSDLDLNISKLGGFSESFISVFFHAYFFEYFIISSDSVKRLNWPFFLHEICFPAYHIWREACK